MNFTPSIFSPLFIVCFCLVLTGCNDEDERNTLQSLVVSQPTPENNNAIKIEKSDSDIREAYINYLQHASKEDLSRSEALNRLASIEFDLSEKILTNEIDEQKATELANEKLQTVVSLLETSLQDYPNAKHNDSTYYQLAKVNDQLGNYQASQKALVHLANNYPASKFYLEAQFRLAEHAFSLKKYREAEDKYTEVVIAKQNDKFYEKSLYKRGWSRFKQEFYTEAADDFIRVINLNQFGDNTSLSTSQQNLFNEYLRAIGLSFSYLNSTEVVHQYLQSIELIDYYYSLYRSLSDELLKQQRYNDAANALESYSKYYPNSKGAPIAALQVIEIWKESGFLIQRSLAFKNFFDKYHPSSKYWQQQKTIDKSHHDHITLALKKKLLTETATYHQLYQTSNNEENFQIAKRWYLNYLQYFDNFSKQDNIHFLLAKLYEQHKEKKNALIHYQFAAFDGDTIINKNAAYRLITLASSLLNEEKDANIQAELNNKIINYSIHYAQQYPTDTHSLKLIAFASDIAYQHEQFSKAITLTELTIGTRNNKLLNQINDIKAKSYFQLKRYDVSERIYLAMANDKSLTKKQKDEAKDGLALSIYYQGKQSMEANNIQQSIVHYARIVDIAPNTETASIGLFDAIALSMQQENWLNAIQYIKIFRQHYPSHKLSTDITKKLSVAYLNSKQNVAAAKELEKLSGHDENIEYNMASLLKAAQLYQENKETQSAIRAYQNYIQRYPQPYTDYAESLFQLTLLNMQLGNEAKTLAWHKVIFSSDKQTPNNVKTDRTNFIASHSAMALARESNNKFTDVKLKQPLKNNLRRKKKKMQESVNYYAKASSYGLAETTTEATYAIAKIYNDFSQSLLTSEVPKHLNDDQQEEYMFLLEDQAFPFEEKAIEFYEVNMSYTNDDIYDQWIVKSLKQLQILFPLRYQRTTKVEEVINALH